MKLSLVVVSKNEQRSLANCLRSCQAIIDEIVVVDSGSSDSTQEIALSFSAKFIHQDWLGFGKQKQFAVRQAKNDWVLCLDADEELSPELASEIQQELSNPRGQVYELIRCNKFLNKFLKHGAGYPDCTVRLFNRNFANWSDDLVHEKVIFQDKLEIIQLKNNFLHDSCDTLAQYLHKQDAYTTIQAQKMFECETKFRFTKLFFSPLVHFIKYYIIKLGFLDGVPGFIHISVGSINSFMKYAKLYSLYQEKLK